jgi:selenocysteine lyase/cysteine desulfurase
MIYRRSFVSALMSLSVWPFTRSGRASAGDIASEADTQSWPKDSDPNYWRWIRRQLLIPPDEAYFNSGTLGACPRQVLDAVTSNMRELEKTKAHVDYRPKHPIYLSGYDPQVELRRKAGTIINANEREVALVQNATMGISFIAQGLDLKAGDEVLLTDQEHDSGKGGWDLRAKRQGIIARKLPIPIPTPDPETVIRIFADAISPRTRVIAIPHITSRYGVVLPVRQICELGRQRGIFTFIDGAQAVGQLRVDVKQIGCDAYATSPHKWLLAPPGNGLLYVREDRAQQVWATLACQQWDNQTDVGFRLMQFGTGNLSLLVGLDAALDFHLRIGSERIERRVIALADRLRNGLKQIEGTRIVSPTHPALAGAIVTYGVKGATGPQLQDELWNRKKIRVRSQGEEAVRQSVHFFNNAEEIDTTLEIVRSLAKKL